MCVGDVGTANHLVCQETRRKWENEFDRHYIQPILSHLDAHLSDTRELLANGEIQGDSVTIIRKCQDMLVYVLQSEVCYSVLFTRETRSREQT